MKLILSVIKPFRLEEVREALTGVGVQGLMVSEVKGYGRQSGHTEIYRGAEYAVNFVPKIRLEIVAPDAEVDRIVETISTNAHTGKIGGVVGAIPVHLFAGVWGTLAVVLTNGEPSIGTQILSIAIVGASTFTVTGALWLLLKATMGIRVSAEDELQGLDAAELGLEAYPESGKGSQFV